MKKIIWIRILLGTVFIFSAVVALWGSNMLQAIGILDDRPVIVIDPGHGGVDGGAISRGGVSEKDINLSISLKLKELAEGAGWKVVMIREDDRGLYSDDKNSIRSKKVQDLNNRCKMIKKSEPDIVISIHLNSFPDPSCKGAQIFYSKHSEEGKEIAERIQEKIKLDIDPENKRLPQTKDNIAIMKDHSFPVILVECGFLSNPQEAKLLQQNDYQQRIARSIFQSIKEHFIKYEKIKKIEIPMIESPDSLVGSME